MKSLNSLDEKETITIRSFFDLRFTKARDEQAFLEKSQQTNTALLRSTIAVSILLYNIYFFIILPIRATVTQADLLIPYIIVITLLTSLIVGTKSSTYQKQPAPFHIISALIIPFGILTAMLKVPTLAVDLIYTFSIPIMWLFITFGLRRLYALFIALILTICGIVTLSYLNLPQHVLISASFGYIGFLMTGIFTGYIIEKQSRLSFVQHQLNTSIIAKMELNYELSIKDGLTNLINRRHFDEVGPLKLQDAKRLSSNFHCVLLDIDFFKEYNDYYGHPKGDEVLIAIANKLTQVLRRSTDQVFRVGGEEFAIILLGNKSEEIRHITQSIHSGIKELNIMHEKSTISNLLTISIGVAALEPSLHESFASLYSKADKALYSAKESGRNKTCFSS